MEKRKRMREGVKEESERKMVRERYSKSEQMMGLFVRGGREEKENREL